MDPKPSGDHSSQIISTSLRCSAMENDLSAIGADVENPRCAAFYVYVDGPSCIDASPMAAFPSHVIP